MTKHKSLFILIVVSLIFFLRKGLQYVIIGDPIPLGIVSVFIVLLAIYFNNRTKFHLVSKTWAILLIIWSVVRIFFAIMNQATDVFSEYHLQTQFGLLSILLSFAMLFMGFYILKSSRSN